MKTLHLLVFVPSLVLAKISVQQNDRESDRFKVLVDIIAFNTMESGCTNFMTFGYFPDSFYEQRTIMPFTFITSNLDDEYLLEDDTFLEDIVPYKPCYIIISCYNFTDFEESLRKVMQSPYWYPPANIIVIYDKEESKLLIAKIFFALWYFRASNVLLFQYDDEAEYVTQFNPFVVDFSGDIFGCRTTSTVTSLVQSFEEGFFCEEECQNVSIHSEHRQLRFGTCIGLHSHQIPIPYTTGKENLAELNLLERKGNNLNGFALRALTTDILPFLSVTQLSNGKYELGSRDGIMWTALSELMNFTIDLSASENVLYARNYELNVQQVFTMGHRKGDLFLPPIYLFLIVILDLDFSFQFKDSGVCFMSHRAPFETISFSIKSLQENVALIIQYYACFLCIWIVFNLYSIFESGKLTSDQVGKDFLNTLRSVISISVHKPPKKQTFRYFMTIILWCYFIINFTTQAAITSFLAASKRLPEVETFTDIVEKGYRVQGIPSPDAVLPDEDNELFKKINAKLEPVRNMFECIEAMKNDSQRFCLIDCAVGRYMARNYLDEKGEQFLHVAQDRVHNYYLNYVFPQYSVLTEFVNKYLMMFYEAGLIKKWEDYRFNDLKAEAPIKALGMEELHSAFIGYFGVLSIIFIVFLFELVIGNLKKI